MDGGCLNDVMVKALHANTYTAWMALHGSYGLPWTTMVIYYDIQCSTHVWYNNNNNNNNNKIVHGAGNPG